MNVLVERYFHLTLNWIVEYPALYGHYPKDIPTIPRKFIYQNGKNQVDIIVGNTDNKTHAFFFWRR